MELLKTLITSSEKAANIARLLRHNDKLFQKLIEQKPIEEANPRFQEDFKTLADVLIQAMVKHDVGQKFPSMGERVYGEESNHFFSKKLNKELIVEVKCNSIDTALMLAELLNDDREIANILAEEIHKDVSIEEINTKILPDETISFDLEQLSIWIDPIDGTNEYIRGGYDEKIENVYPKGLKCVTVLIGVYNSEGHPVMGLINQPFFEQRIDEGFQCHWGVCSHENGCTKRLSSLEISPERKKSVVICTGGTEDIKILETLRKSGFKLITACGAGYKLLTVILGVSDAYILSKGTTYLWDTCGPHAILLALGGGIVEMAGIKSNQRNDLKYKEPENSKCNKLGIIAYRNTEVLEKLLQLPWDNY
uniref:inositol-1,4-bisphosphate 1-phosphatase n=1 Tax=Dendroctonus ponderosae TaxID=77166 RepID=J3JZ63_DENPD|nr:unknown [Dendroctonus ponderosae]